MVARLFFLCPALFLATCEKPLRLPYIPPELHNWQTPYRGVRGMKLHVFDTGSLRLPRALVFRGGGWTTEKKMAVPAFVIEHPRHGLIVFDTGLNHEMAHGADNYLGRFLSAVTHAEMQPGQDIVSQMKKEGLPPEKVGYVVLSHLHFDHGGEVESFPQAEVVVARREYDASKDQGAFSLYRPSEFDDITKWRFIDYAPNRPYATFTAHENLFADGSLILIDAIGHTPGSQALLVRLASRPVLLCGDLAWVKENYRFAAFPGILADRETWWDRLWRMKKFKELVPELVIFPGHELPAKEDSDFPDIVVHSFEKP